MECDEDDVVVTTTKYVGMDSLKYQKELKEVMGFLVDLSKAGKSLPQNVYDQAATELIQSTIALKTQATTAPAT